MFGKFGTTNHSITCIFPYKIVLSLQIRRCQNYQRLNAKYQTSLVIQQNSILISHQATQSPKLNLDPWSWTSGLWVWHCPKCQTARPYTHRLGPASWGFQCPRRTRSSRTAPFSRWKVASYIKYWTGKERWSRKGQRGTYISEQNGKMGPFLLNMLEFRNNTQNPQFPPMNYRSRDARFYCG